MKALVKLKAEPGLWKQEVPMPVINDDEVLVKVHKTSICGTDLHIYKWDAWAQKAIPVPVVVGHEFMGEIAELGKNVTGLKVGQRVTGEGHIVCGKCRCCRTGRQHICRNTLGLGYSSYPGCFAEYCKIPAYNVFPLPDGISDEQASIMDPLGNAVHASFSFDIAGEDVLITGAGPIGMMSAAIARKAGARTVVVSDVNDYRLDLAAKLGATHTVNVKNEKLDDVAKKLGLDEGFSIGLEMSGSPAGINDMLRNISYGGKIALMGMLPQNTGIDWNTVLFKGLILKGMYGREMFGTWYKTAAMLESGLDLAPLITHRLPADEFQKGFDAMLNGNCGKVILNWT